MDMTILMEWTVQIICVWASLSVLAVLWFYFFGKDKMDKCILSPEKESIFYRIIQYGFVCALFSVCMLGVSQSLIIIPEGWGWMDEDGEWISTRIKIGAYGGFLLALWLLSGIGRGLTIDATMRKLDKQIEKKEDLEEKKKLQEVKKWCKGEGL